MKRKLFKTLKKIGVGTITLIAGLIIMGSIFMHLSPEFGGEPTEAQKKQYQQSGHFEDGKFVNETLTTMEMGAGKLMSILGDYIKGVPNQNPKQPIPVKKVKPSSLVAKPDSLARLTWFGHSAFLLEINGLNLLLDPMLGDSPSPLPILGAKRYSNELPIEIDKLPSIDAVIISHDHYDHLDYGSIKKLKGKVEAFYVPLGVGAHLAAWGIATDKIHELNWWEEADFKGLKLACTPARHFSGRGLADRFATFWCSWVIKTESNAIYFSGDGGYGGHFKQIGEKYGPFDFAMMECGQYDERWAEIHMMPEETVQASLDINAKRMMPIHWGAFTLALHAWTDPIERASNKAQEVGLPLATPQIGEQILLFEEAYPKQKWWQLLQ